MKKYSLFLFVLSFILLGFFGFKTNLVSAANCAPGDLFSTITGQACGTTILPTECSPGDLFSSLTGKSCGEKRPIFSCNANPDFKINYKGDDVKTLQAQLNEQGANLKVDGAYGLLTQAARLRHCPPSYALSISTTSLQNGTVGTSYSASIAGSGGGNNSYQWSVSGLPAGLQTIEANIACAVGLPCMNKASILISGTPTTAGTYTVSVKLTSGTQTVFREFILVISAAGTSSITVLSPNGSETWAQGTSQPIQWSSKRTNTCTTGTQCVVPTYDITLIEYFDDQFSCAISDSAGCRYPTFTIAKGVPGPLYDWLVGSNLSSSDSMSGSVIYDGSRYKIKVCQSGSSICDSSDSYFNIINGKTKTLSINTTSLSSGTVGTAYMASIYGDNGSNVYDQNHGYAWSISGLPPGLTNSLPIGMVGGVCQYGCSSTLISGTPTTAGTYTVTVKLTSGTQIVFKEFILVVAKTDPVENPPTINTTSLSKGTVGASYSVPLNGYGSTWSAYGLPDGLSLSNLVSNSTCSGISSNYTVAPCETSTTISGTPTTAGTYTVTITLTSGTRSVSKQFILVISAAGTLSISTTSLQNGTVGTSYSASIAGSGGGNNSYQWSVSGLPAGLQTIEANITCATGIPCLNQSPITIIGTPTTAGNYAVNVTLTSGTQTVSKQFSLVVAGFLYALPFCAQRPMPDCPAGLNCVQVMPAIKTYTSYDTFNNDKATYLYAGNCSSSGNVLGVNSFNFTQLLKEGSRGNEVMELQKFLNVAGYDVGNIDGIFGYNVKVALIKFQIANNLKADGIVGSEIRTLLNKSR